MRTKVSLALGPRQPLSRQSAWGCFTTNLALPGFGSLAAGRVSGYPQAFISIAGLALSAFFAARFFGWYAVNSPRFNGDNGDPLATLAEMWTAVRWPLLGMAVFAAGWLWALLSSLQILAEARKAEPPRLSQQ